MCLPLTILFITLQLIDMSEAACPHCGKQFSRKDSLNRHIRTQHNAPANGFISSFPIKNSFVGTNKDCGGFKMLHPFTCMTVGMSGVGKTYWVMKLLEHAQQSIQPPPERVVWSYSHWQPAYTRLQQILPWIEFVRGIPVDMEQDWYFDPKVNNLFVIDDQMQESSNNDQIMNLFTKGSHHRNLSVLYLLQNAYHRGKINRTVSLNCHYLVLFKNPRDKMQIMTLAKQMYPRNTQQFLQKYEEAVQRPYGYLFVDLKPTTPDHCRLRKNVLPGEEQFDSQNGQVSVAATYSNPQSFSASPIINQMKKLDQEMNNDLNRTDLHPDIQAKLYSQHLQQFLGMKKQRESPPIPRWPTPTSPPLQSIEPEEEEEETETHSQENREEIRTPLSSLDFQTPSLSLQKTLPYPPEQALGQKRRPRPLIELPEYGSPSYNKLGKWAHASDEDVRRARRHMRRALKTSRPPRRLALKNREGLNIPFEED